MASRPKKLCPPCHQLRPVTLKDEFAVHYRSDGSTCPMSGEPVTPPPPTPEEQADPLAGFLLGSFGYNGAQISHRRCPWKLSVDNISLAELIDYATVHLKRCPAREET